MPRGRPRKQQPEPNEQFNGGAASNERLDKLPVLANVIDSATERKKDAAGGLAEIYKRAELDGFHKRALKEAVRLRNLDPAERRDYLSSLNAYCDKLGIWNQDDMFDPEPRTPAPPDEGDDEAYDDDLEESTTQAIAEVSGYTYETGRQAGLKGENSTNNPWPEGTKANTSWQNGWMKGQEQIAQNFDRPSSRPQSAAN